MPQPHRWTGVDCTATAARLNSLPCGGGTPPPFFGDFMCVHNPDYVTADTTEYDGIIAVIETMECQDPQKRKPGWWQPNGKPNLIELAMRIHGDTGRGTPASYRECALRVRDLRHG